MTGFIPATVPVLTKAYVAGATNSHNLPVDRWADPVEQMTYGWSAPTSAEPKLVGQNRVVVDVELLAPEGFMVGPRDLVVLGGREFTVEGEPEDYNFGPFGFRPGSVVNLKRIEG